MANDYKTPGVYVEEKDAFPRSIVEVPTSIPVFVGYTEISVRNGKSLRDIPTKISSFQEFTDWFGTGKPCSFQVDKSKAIDIDSLALTDRYYLFDSIRLFYANGGDTCYIVSLGDYTTDISKNVMLKPFNENGILEREIEPTIVVVPDALSLKRDECYEVYKSALGHCRRIQNRVLIMDVHNGFDEGKMSSDLQAFRDGIGIEGLNYGAVYYPWIQASVVPKTELSYENLSVDTDDLKNLFTEDEAGDVVDQFNAGTEKDNAASKENLHMGMLAVSPTYKDAIESMTEQANILPIAGAMAGIYTEVDNDRGVWKAPANVNLNSVIGPTVNISNEHQEEMNIDALTGKSINAIRVFPGVGTLVWGARTLDGNSLDWRYINVRRTMIMIEQSIKKALRGYVFEPNNATTWVTVKSMINNFLTEVWKRGGLAGAVPEDAFDVQVGLGSTMTAQNILEGKMIVSVKVAVARPAEFIIIRFEQQMQKS